MDLNVIQNVQNDFSFQNKKVFASFRSNTNFLTTAQTLTDALYSLFLLLIDKISIFHTKQLLQMCYFILKENHTLKQ